MPSSRAIAGGPPAVVRNAVQETKRNAVELSKLQFELSDLKGKLREVAHEIAKSFDAAFEGATWAPDVSAQSRYISWQRDDSGPFVREDGTIGINSTKGRLTLVDRATGNLKKVDATMPYPDPITGKQTGTPLLRLYRRLGDDVSRQEAKIWNLQLESANVHAALADVTQRVVNGDAGLRVTPVNGLPRGRTPSESAFDASTSTAAVMTQDAKGRIRVFAQSVSLHEHKTPLSSAPFVWHEVTEPAGQ